MASLYKASLDGCLDKASLDGCLDKASQDKVKDVSTSAFLLWNACIPVKDACIPVVPF
jgi:hypothetical protein